MIKPVALILAGGEGQRLGGVRKADLKFNGERLIDRLCNRLSREASHILVSTGPDGRGLGGLPAGAEPLPDPGPPVAGPIAGLLALARWIENTGSDAQFFVTMAVDTPLLPSDFLFRLRRELPPDSLAAFAVSAGQTYPTNAIWRRQALLDLPGVIAGENPPNSPRAYLESIGAVPVTWPDEPDGNPFDNVNTLPDLVALSRRARP